MLGRLILAVTAPLWLTAAAASAQSPGAPLERAEYQVKLGTLDAGTGEMTLVGHDTVDAHDTYHAVLHIEGGLGP
jgi:hypothetical protein